MIGSVVTIQYWRDASMHPPPENTMLLIYTNNNTQHMGKYVRGSWFVNDRAWAVKVLWWTELTDPNKG